MNSLARNPALYLLAIVTFSGCQYSYTVLDTGSAGKQQVPQERVELIKEIIEMTDNTARLARLEKLFNDIKDPDPVALNVLGAALVIDEKPDSARVVFDQVYYLLKEQGLMVVSDNSVLPDHLSYPSQVHASVNLDQDDYREIITGLQKKITGGERETLFSALHNRSGHIPDPPLLEGLVGLALESLNEPEDSDPLYPKIFTYNTHEENSFDRTRLAKNAVLQNRLINAILMKDERFIKKVIMKMEQVRKTQRSREFNALFQIGVDLIDSRRYWLHQDSAESSDAFDTHWTMLRRM